MPKHIDNARENAGNNRAMEFKPMPSKYDMLMSREIADDMCYFPKEVVFAYCKEAPKAGSVLDEVYYVASQCLDEYEAYKMVDRWLWQPGAFRNREHELNRTKFSDISIDDWRYMLLEINKQISRTVALNSKQGPGEFHKDDRWSFRYGIAKGQDKLDKFIPDLVAMLGDNKQSFSYAKALQVLFAIGMEEAPFVFSNMATASVFVNLLLCYYGMRPVSPTFDLSKPTPIREQMEKLIIEHKAYSDDVMNTAAFASETRIPAYNQAAYNLAKEYWCYTQQISKEKLLLLDSIMAHISAPGQVGNIEVIVSASAFNKALSYIRDRKMTGIFDCALDTIQQEVLKPLLSKSKCEYRAKIEVKAMKVGEMPHYPTIVINIASNQDAKKYGELLYKTLASTALLCELEIVKGKADVIVRIELPDGFRARSDYIALRDSIRHQVKITQIEVNSGILVQRR